MPATPRTRWPRLLAGLAALLAAGAAAAGEPLGATAQRPIVYGGDASFPPYEYLDERGQPAGLNVDLIREVARLQGLQLTVRLMPWGALLAELEAGRVDVAAMYRSAARARLVDFAIPHELVYHELFVRRGDRPVAGLAELAGRRVLVEVDSYSADALAAMGLAAELRPVASEPEALRALARGEGDVALVTQTVGRPFQARAELAGRIAPTGPPVLLSEYAFVTARGRRDLVERLNEGVAGAKASGAFERIYQRWIRPDQSAWLARLAGWALGAALLVVLLVVIWNQALRRRVAAQTAAVRQQFEAKERAKAALAESERSLRTAQKMEAVGRLAGGVAHDFNNVLGIILSYATFVREQLTERGLPTADVDEVLSASERAARLTRQLLAFSRATPLDTVRLDLGAVIGGMRAMLQRLVGDHIRVEVEVPGAPVWVESQATLIEQILLNLAANGRDAMPSGGRLAVAVEERALPAGNGEALPPGRYAVVSVADEGAGMDQATLARIFDPFFTTKPEGRGTGLGLATVLANVTKLGGRVTTSSAPGAGATFTIFLPLASGPAAASAAGVAAEAVHGRGRTVLLVEDDEVLRRAARVSLARAGFRVVEAADGAVALEADAREGRPDALITDVVMPRLGGADLVAALRRRHPGLPVLFVSGYVRDQDTPDFQAEATAFLPKPYAGAALVAAVLRLISEAEARASAAAADPAPAS